MGFCEGSNEHSGSLKGGEFSDRRAVSFSKKDLLHCSLCAVVLEGHLY
jgi:hypothetical protein